MTCFSIAALVLRMATATPDHLHLEPGLFVRSPCGIEIGAVVRDRQPVLDVGWKLPIAKRFWVRGGAEVARYSVPLLGQGGAAQDGVKRQPTTVDEDVVAKWRIRPRLSFGMTLPLGSQFRVVPEIEVTRGGLFILSLERTF